MSDDNDLIRRGDVLRLLQSGAGLTLTGQAKRVAALTAAPTFTSADLERAWRMGRDAVLADVQELRDVPSVPPGNERAEVYNEACENILRFTAALTPPADLAQRVKGPAHD